jgi:hypothetical protein
MGMYTTHLLIASILLSEADLTMERNPGFMQLVYSYAVAAQ